MFKLSEEYKEILELLKNENLLNKTANFSCFSDDTFTYSIKQGTELYEFSFICDDTLLREIEVSELLELKKLTFFDIGIYFKENGITEKPISIMWSMYNNENLN